jgi:hypothetical protein
MSSYFVSLDLITTVSIGLPANATLPISLTLLGKTTTFNFIWAKACDPIFSVPSFISKLLTPVPQKAPYFISFTYDGIIILCDNLLHPQKVYSGM